MAESNYMSEDRADGRTKSLRFLLLICLNVAMVLVLGAFAAWDYGRGWDVHLRQRREALRSEAVGLLVAAMRLDGESDQFLQSFIDEVCSRMRETSSPGHHIALFLDGQVLEATLHSPSSPQLLAAMKAASRDADGLGETESGLVVVGAARAEGAEVYVTEYIMDIKHLLRSQVLSRMLSMVVLGVGLVFVVNLFAVRFVTRPLGAIVAAVRRVRQGEVGAAAPVPSTTELAFLAREFNAMSSDLAKAEEERRSSMNRARRIQENLVPSLADVSDLPVAFSYAPAAFVAGDYLDIARCKDGAVVLCVADVAGHGVPAALLAAMLKELFTSAVSRCSEPESVLQRVNNRFCAVTLPEDFASMTVVKADRCAGEMRYASAGHESSHLIRVNGEQLILSSTGPVLGVSDSGRWEGKRVPVSTGDRLVLVSDGVPETTSPSQELFGRERLKGLLHACKEDALRDLPGRIMAALTRHRGSALQADDITILAMEM